MNSACKKYGFQMLGALFVYVLAVIGSVLALTRHFLVSWKYAVAILPVLPAMYFAVLIVRSFREMDELQKKIQLEALAFGFTMAAILTLSYGFLQNAGLPAVNWVWVWPVMGICWAIGTLVAQRRYR